MTGPRGSPALLGAGGNMSGLRVVSLRLPRTVLSGIWMSHARTLTAQRRRGHPRRDAPVSDADRRSGYSRLPAADSSTSGVSGTSAGFGTPLKENLASLPSPSASITTI